jgi:hypothetical protein
MYWALNESKLESDVIDKMRIVSGNVFGRKSEFMLPANWKY